MLKFINLYSQAEHNKINYQLLSGLVEKSIKKPSSDLSVVIPAYGRNEFLKPLINSFRKAEAKHNLSISYTVVEHSEERDHLENSIDLGINHIWIPKLKEDPFNKCLAMNIGATSVEAEEYIFHDIDCLVDSDFFKNLYNNIEVKESNAIQTFYGRRVLYLNYELTKKALTNELDIDSLQEGSGDEKDPDYNGVTAPSSVGAPGGSIWINKSTFIKAGGYDPNIFFGYSPEDEFFWDKVSTVSKMDTCTDPIINIFHMEHPPTSNSNQHLGYLKNLTALFKSLSPDEKIKFIRLQRESLMLAYKYNQT